ncbi:DUF7529 family protein [Halostella litorea]|uniref:DUF7529 family protein n=1 Tax=Halostella litorea TaxID=2528831 RepID=UPI001092A2DE|nr:hypothetical protein [Halostella litorea]
MRDVDDSDETPDGIDHPGDPEELSASGGIHKDAWAQTLDDMQALAAELEEEGWDTVLTVPALDTAPEPPEDGQEGRWGLIHVVPDNHAEAIRDAVEDGEFPRFDVFRAEAEGRVFHVTQLLDPESGIAILVAANFERHQARGVVNVATDEDELYTHLQTLDGTHLGTFRHDDYGKFFPNADRLADLGDEE